MYVKSTAALKRLAIVTRNHVIYKVLIANQTIYTLALNSVSVSIGRGRWCGVDRQQQTNDYDD